MAVGNDTIQHDLMQVGRLKLQHLIDARPTDHICRTSDLLRHAVLGPTKCAVDQVLAVAVQQAKGVSVGARRDLDELGKAIADLGDGQGAQEREIKECA